MAHHRKDLSGARIERNGRTWARAQGLFRDLLQVEVNGQLNLFSGNRFLGGQAVHFLADAVNDHAPHAVRALKQIVVLALQAGLSGEVAGAELAVAGFDLLLADFTDIAGGMSEESCREVTPPRDGNHFQDGNVRAMRFDESDVRG